MIGYVTLGTNDLERGAKFYDALAAELGTPRMMEEPTFIAWGTPDGGAGIGLTKPHDGKAATVGNGVMVALQAASRSLIRTSAEDWMSAAWEGLEGLGGKRKMKVCLAFQVPA